MRHNQDSKNVAKRERPGERRGCLDTCGSFGSAESVQMLKYFAVSANGVGDGLDVGMLEMRTPEDYSFKYFT